MRRKLEFFERRIDELTRSLTDVQLWLVEARSTEEHRTLIDGLLASGEAAERDLFLCELTSQPRAAPVSVSLREVLRAVDGTRGLPSDKPAFQSRGSYLEGGRQIGSADPFSIRQTASWLRVRSQ